MNGNTYRSILFLVSILAGIENVFALDFQWLTLYETTRFNESIPFTTGDTLEGPVHSNSQIAISGSPVFYGQVSTTAADFSHGTGYAPQFLGPPPLFSVPRFDIMVGMYTLRTSAGNQGNLFTPPPHHLCLLRFLVDSVWVYTSYAGVPFDSTDRQTVQLTRSKNALYFNCPIRVMGLVRGQVVVGSEGTINIDDDLRYVDANPFTGQTPSNSQNYLALASTGDIKVSNTDANGRENSSGMGRVQTNQQLTSVVITAALYALGGSFTFENQNDPDSGYDYGSQDERGTLSLFGGIVQYRRGYLHRSNRGGTGYLRNLHFDPRLPGWNDYVYNDNVSVWIDTLDFGNIPIGLTTTDTIDIPSRVPGALGGVSASLPFHAQRIEPLLGSIFRVPVSITPAHPVAYHGVLTVSMPYHTRQIVLLAHGVPPHDPPQNVEPVGCPTLRKVDVTAYPNPFNLSTELRYTLTEAGPAKIVIYDLQGREVHRFEMTDETAGEHSLRFNAHGLASGVYFAQLSAGSQIVTQKLLLMK